MKRLAYLWIVFSLFAHVGFATDWPGFGGPHGNRTTTDTGFATHWSAEKNIKWRVPLESPDNGSPIVIQGKVFLLGSADRGKQRSTLAFDRNTGQQLWKQTVPFDKSEETHNTNPHAPSTPVSDGERVIVWHRSAGMHCYDLEGKPLWSRDLGEFHHIWGGGSSPIIYRDLVIQLCGPGERTFVIALNKRTGETVWQTPNEPGGSASSQGKYIGTWSTPSVIQVGGQDQLLVPLHSRVVAYDLRDGKELWMVDGLSSEKGNLAYSSAMVGDGVAVVLGGFGGPGFGFKLGGSGDMTAENRLWHHTSSNPQRIGTGVIVNGYLYMANADGPGSIQCLNVLTGDETWKERRTKDGPHWGSIVYADMHLYVTGQTGITRVFRPNPEKYEVVAENDLKERSNSTPAFSDGEIFLRTFDALYCIANQP
ncbi:MAG: PQQ-binding-like beta-propeller repeat protein [Planctomycetaceae bacterium]